MRQFVGNVLRSAGYDVMEAVDGDDALSRFGDTCVDLVISDVDMPVMDGLTFLKEIRKHPVHRLVPVMMLATDSSEVKKSEVRAAGAKAWMVKPFRSAQILAAVSELVTPRLGGCSGPWRECGEKRDNAQPGCARAMA